MAKACNCRSPPCHQFFNNPRQLHSVKTGYIWGCHLAVVFSGALKVPKHYVHVLRVKDLRHRMFDVLVKHSLHAVLIAHCNGLSGLMCKDTLPLLA